MGGKGKHLCECGRREAVVIVFVSTTDQSLVAPAGEGLRAIMHCEECDREAETAMAAVRRFLDEVLDPILDSGKKSGRGSKPKK